MMIFVPFIAFSLAAALYYKVTHQKKSSQSGAKNKLFNITQKIGYAPTKTTTINTNNHRQIRPSAHQALSYGSATNKPFSSCIGIDETKKKQLSQLTGNTLNQKVTNTTRSIIIFTDTELEHIRAGYIHQSTGKRRLSSSNRDSYITGRNGKIFDARKIIKVMQKKIANEYSNESHENSMAFKLQLLQAGIRALMAQDELPKNFALSDNCIVHRTVKNVTYGELKKIAKTRKLTVHGENPGNRKNIISNSFQQPRITAIKINYRIKSTRPFKH